MIHSMKLLRLEYFALFLISIFLTYVFSSKINWWHFLLLFFSIDILSYYPGRIWSLINHNDIPPRIFYIIYNCCHNISLLLFASLVWIYFLKDNYSFLALFVHISIDRGILGNFPKVVSDEFKKPTFS